MLSKLRTLFLPSKPIETKGQNNSLKNSKTAIRYMNDALFVSNLGSILLSYRKHIKEPSDKISVFHDLMKTDLNTLLFAIFFIGFTIKAYLDDNKILRCEEAKGDCSSVYSQKYTYYLFFSIFTWSLYTISGFHIASSYQNASLFFILSLTVNSTYIVLKLVISIKEKKGDAEKTNKRNSHLVFLCFNILYVVTLIEMRKTRTNIHIVDVMSFSCYSLVRLLH